MARKDSRVGLSGLALAMAAGAVILAVQADTPSALAAEAAAPAPPLIQSAEVLPAVSVASPSPAGDSYSSGMDAFRAGRYVEARAALSAAVRSGQLSKAQEDQAVGALNKLSHMILGTTITPDDPFVLVVTVKPGDSLWSICRKAGTAVPLDVIRRINRLDDDRSLRPGQMLKVPLGRFEAVVTKHRFTLDIYLRRPGVAPVFVNRVPVGLGRDDGTPEGSFRVAAKATHATWYPPASMAKEGKTKPVKWGRKGYPLGKEGYFIALSGVDPATRGRRGYGIHGTNAQWSVGAAHSHGCIRLKDADIESVFGLLATGSSVHIRH